jgi:hypothetical protein
LRPTGAPEGDAQSLGSKPIARRSLSGTSHGGRRGVNRGRHADHPFHVPGGHKSYPSVTSPAACCNDACSRCGPKPAGRLQFLKWAANRLRAEKPLAQRGTPGDNRRHCDEDGVLGAHPQYPRPRARGGDRVGAAARACSWPSPWTASPANGVRRGGSDDRAPRSDTVLARYTAGA